MTTLQRHDPIRVTAAVCAALAMIGAAAFATLSAPPSFAQNTGDSGGPQLLPGAAFGAPAGGLHGGGSRAPATPQGQRPQQGQRPPRGPLPSRPPAAGGYVYRGRTFPTVPDQPYRWPAGYAYRRFFAGGHLPQPLRQPDYFIANFADYQLDAPPPGFGWIRYGPDALLIDVRTGRIAQSVLGMFGA